LLDLNQMIFINQPWLQCVVLSMTVWLLLWCYQLLLFSIF